MAQGDVYSQRYKGISLCLAMLSRALNGSYVNFGVFELYSDTALQNALDAAMKMALSIHPEEVRHSLRIRHHLSVPTAAVLPTVQAFPR